MTLIDRLWAATGPDRALADEVLLACGWTQYEEGALDNPTIVWRDPNEDDFYDGDQPNPLASVDAALTLIPDGWCWKLTHERDDKLFRFLIRKSARLEDLAEAFIISMPHSAIAVAYGALRARGVEG